MTTALPPVPPKQPAVDNKPNTETVVTKQPKAANPLRWLNTLLLVVCALALSAGVYLYWQTLQKPKIEVLTREGVISKIQTQTGKDIAISTVHVVIGFLEGWLVDME